MKILTAISLCVVLLGCSIGNSRFNEGMKAFSSADITKSTNTLLIGEMYPSGKRVSISNSQARRLQSILAHARQAPEDLPSNRVMVSPSPNLCSLQIAGKTWYFMPPAKPHRFRLPTAQQKQFEEILSDEFGLK